MPHNSRHHSRRNAQKLFVVMRPVKYPNRRALSMAPFDSSVWLIWVRLLVVEWFKSESSLKIYCFWDCDQWRWLSGSHWAAWERSWNATRESSLVGGSQVDLLGFSSSTLLLEFSLAILYWDSLLRSSSGILAILDSGIHVWVSSDLKQSTEV